MQTMHGIPKEVMPGFNHTEVPRLVPLLGLA